MDRIGGDSTTEATENAEEGMVGTVINADKTGI